MNVCLVCDLVALPGAARCSGCGEALDPGASATRVDGRYQLDRLLGQGSFGQVWRARDLVLRREVAIKILSSAIVNSDHDVRRFQREAAALASVRTDHIPQVHAFGEHEGSFFFVMELVEGATLADIISEHAAVGDTVSLHRALVMLREILVGLSAVHAAGLIHRDVKPENVMIEWRSGRPVLVDFGLALSSAEASVRATMRLGTPAYMAPELIRGEHIEFAADIYSFGCMAFELLTGRLPYEAPHVFALLHAQTETPAPSLSSVRPSLGPLDAVIGRAMAKEPAERWESAAALAAALEHAGRRWLTPTPEAASPSVEEDLGPATVRILVVDDDEDFAKLCVSAAQIALFGTGARVARARSGEEALRYLRTKRVGLLLLDYQMPGMDGVETLSRLRELEGGKMTHVVVVSAAAPQEAERRLRALGVERVLRKPVELSTIVDEVHGFARRAGWVTDGALAD